MNDPRLTGGFKGSPLDRLIRALQRNVVDPAGRELREFVRGDGMSGDIGLSDVGRTRPARALMSLGQEINDALPGVQDFAERTDRKVRRGIRGFLSRF